MKKRGVVGISKKALLCIMAVLLLVTVTTVLSACAGSGIDISKDVDEKATFPEFTRDPDDTYEWEESTEPPTETETEPETEEPVELVGLREAFANYFYIGVALPNNVLQNWVRYKDVILKNFNSITCENEMKPDFMLSQSESRKNLDVTYTDPVVHFSSPQLAVKYATQNNIKMRLHTLVWHAQTPKWFFTEDYTNEGNLVSRDVMLQRMESYIKQVLTYYKENYPGLIYAVDVVNEAFDVGNGDENGIRRVDNLWYQTIGPDYVYYAFYYARKYAADDMKLFYNDYGCMYKIDLILRNLKKIKSEGLIDGIGMQAHMDYDTDSNAFKKAMRAFVEAGYELQLTELDIGVKKNNEAQFKAQANQYKRIFQAAKELVERGYKVTSITVWGLTDTLTWRSGQYPLLFNSDLTPKPAISAILSVFDK